MSKLFNSDEEQMDFVSELEFATYGLAMLHPSYAKKRERYRRTPADKDGNRETVKHVFSKEEMAIREEDTARASRFIRKRLEYQGVGTVLLDRLSDEQLYYYALGISDA